MYQGKVTVHPMPGVKPITFWFPIQCWAVITILWSNNTKTHNKVTRVVACPFFVQWWAVAYYKSMGSKSISPPELRMGLFLCDTHKIYYCSGKVLINITSLLSVICIFYAYSLQFFTVNCDIWKHHVFHYINSWSSIGSGQCHSTPVGHPSVLQPLL